MKASEFASLLRAEIRKRGDGEVRFIDDEHLCEFAAFAADADFAVMITDADEENLSNLFNLRLEGELVPERLEKPKGRKKPIIHHRMAGELVSWLESEIAEKGDGEFSAHDSLHRCRFIIREVGYDDDRVSADGKTPVHVIEGVFEWY